MTSFLFYSPTLNINCLVEKNNIFLRFCLCIFESDTFKSDCPVKIFRKMMKYLKITFIYNTSFTVFLEILKKKKEKKALKKKKKKKSLKKKKKKKPSENDQLTGHFQSFSIYFFFVLSTLNLKKIP